ncbi:outer membrane lipoprotein-sorting protein [Saccharophagus degradans]|uniref:Outer membrane lipoprotein-sorting protein n=1 Tax=Saccharophagus degradans TaxID=86304 RepID=A0AAW7X677_9GAMM|nr:outer membrane lipoprotein-sorting protein [Saccharophagus degradans]MDO6422007.1 outer membrane lipoprotein-sorting protein [Saccharophagus degradans]MDO6606300.1 outer membrane lipoprotein-sorting protein [Saccharophagus degradans]
MKKRSTTVFIQCIASLFALVLLAPTPFAAELTAAEIMKQVDDRYTGDTSYSDAVLTLIDNKDRQRVRNLAMYGQTKDDVEKAVIFFTTPADVKGTAYMSFDWEDENKEDDTWLYLPALQKIKRIASTDESGSFMGSDFSYTDINGTDYPDFTYTMEKESDMVDGHDCWVIISTPKNEDVIDKTGYTQTKSWVRKDILIVVKGIINVKRGKRVKYFSASELEQIDGVWTAKKLQMITTRNNKKEHASVLVVNNTRYNQGVDEEIFTTQAMQRGL